jgi:ribosomal RNA-processing protein 12
MSLASEVGFMRKADGRIKFDKQKKPDAEEGEKTVGNRWQSKKSTSAPLKRQRVEAVGQAYKSSKASGDVKRAGMQEPHAYIPLNASFVGSNK